ncbi:PQQ-binding-like beta-propeller repeat protein [Natronogracilivirga saccharolytica]|nr:PQQ-binding-like beta-propeller repeat protein [Natronogracilivirga saccharolytica]
MPAFDFEETWHLTEDYPALQWQDDVEPLTLPPRKVTLAAPDSAGTGLTRVPQLTWNPDDRAETYRIQLSDGPDFETLHLDETTSATEWTVSDSLDFEATWHWRVRAVNESAEGEWSDSWSFTTVVEPGMVALEDPANSAGHVNARPAFSWAGADGADYYDFQLSADSSFSTLEAELTDLAETSVRLADTLNPLSSYYWRVRSGNIGGKSDWSEPWSFTTIDLPDEPVLVSPADSSLQLDPPVSFEWSAADRAEAYRIRIYANESEPENLVVDSLLSDTTFAYSNLSHTNIYLWEVAGQNSAGEGPSSQSSLFTIRVQTPLLTSPEPDQQNVPRYPQLVWEPVEEATTYLVQLSQDSLFEETIVQYDVSENNTVEPGPLKWRSTYYWRAYAVAGEDTSHASPASSFTVGGPVFTFEPEQLGFGTVRTGNSAERSISIENSGTDSLFLADIALPDERLQIMLPDSIDPDTQPEGHHNGLPAGESLEAVVTLDGSSPGHIDGYMVFSDGLGTRDSLRITGFVGIGELAFDTDTLSFASTRVGEMTREAVTLTNTGNDTLSVQSVTVSDGTYGSSLRSFTLAPDEAIVDSITFAPTMDPASTGHVIYRGADDHRDTLHIKSNTVPVIDHPEDRSLTTGRRELTTEVPLSAGESLDPDGSQLSYQWQLLLGSNDGGDPELLSGEPDFTFDAPVGTNQVRLTVTDAAGASDSADFRVDVRTFVREMDEAVEAGITAYGDSADYNLFIADVSYTPGDGSRIFEVDGQLQNRFNLTVPQAIRTAASVSADSSVFITNGPNLNGFDNRGVELWSTKGLGGAATVTPTIDTRNRTIYVGVTNNNLFAYDYQTGENRWTYRVDAPISASAVITRDQKLIFPTEAGTLYGFDLEAIGDADDAGPAWERNFEDGVVHAPAIDSEDNIIVGTQEGNLMKISFGSAGNMALLWDESVCERVTTSPVIDGAGDIYFGCDDGQLYKVDGQNGSVAWSYPSGGTIAATPAISDYGRIYFGNDEGLLTALTLDGEKAWAFHGDGGIQADVLHISGTTYIGTMDGFVYGFYDEGGRGGQVAAKASATSGRNKSGDTAEAGGNAAARDTSDAGDTTAAGDISEARDSSAAGDKSESGDTAEVAVQASAPQWGTYMGNNRRTGWASDQDDPTATEAESDRRDIPSEFKLSQNYPNPFNPVTQIEYELPSEAHVRLEVYNMLGQRVQVLVDEQQSPGAHTAEFDGTALASGVYLYRIVADGFVKTRKMTMVK